MRPNNQFGSSGKQESMPFGKAIALGGSHEEFKYNSPSIKLGGVAQSQPFLNVPRSK